MEDISLDELLEKVSLPFDRIKGSTKRADVLESLAKRAGVSGDVIQVAMWETQWDAKVQDDESRPAHPPPPPPSSHSKPPLHGSPQPQQQQPVPLGGYRPSDLAVEFKDPLKGSSLSFRQHSGGGMFYHVNGQQRPPFSLMRLSVRHQRGPRLEFPGLATAATVPWENAQAVLLGLRAIAEASGVQHNIPHDGIARRPSQNPVPPPMGGVKVPAQPARSPRHTPPTPPPAHVPVPHVPYAAEPPALTSPSSPRRMSSHSGVQPVGAAEGQQEGDDEATEKSNTSASWRHDPYMWGGDTASLNDDTSLATDDTFSCRDSTLVEQVDPRVGGIELPPERPDRARVRIPDGGVLQLPPGIVERIVNAKYGEGDKWYSATKPVRHVTRAAGVGPLFVSTESLCLKDPSPGNPKILVVVFKPLPMASKWLQHQQQLQSMGPILTAASPPAYPAYSGQPAARVGQKLGRQESDAASVASSLDPPALDEYTHTLDESFGDVTSGADASSKAQPHTFLLYVRFKYGRCGAFSYHRPLPFDTDVIVEGDAGEDLGSVTDSRPAGPADGYDRPAVLRLAAPQEGERWRTTLAEQERSARMRVQELLDKHSAGVRVLHAEFQYDMRKLTFHFVCSETRPNLQQVQTLCAGMWKCKVVFQRCQGKRVETDGRPRPAAAARQLHADAARSV